VKTIVVASKNPVKEQAVRRAFSRMFPREQFSVMVVSIQSGVADQPMSDKETLLGAIARAEHARDGVKVADYWIGIEGGVEDSTDGMAAFAWAVVYDGKRFGKGRTGTFLLPNAVAEYVRQGLELGDADDAVFEMQNSKRKMGAVGILTQGVIDRTGLYEHAVVLALIPFKNPGQYDTNPMSDRKTH
jgi:inosine/xanthosine triphosphatase